MKAPAHAGGGGDDRDAHKLRNPEKRLHPLAMCIIQDFCYIPNALDKKGLFVCGI